MDNNTQKYKATEEEERILMAHGPRYYELPNRDLRRMEITQDACEELKAVSERAREYWTVKIVRQWWQNHKKLFLNSTTRVARECSPPAPIHIDTDLTEGHGSVAHVVEPPMPNVAPVAEIGPEVENHTASGDCDITRVSSAAFLDWAGNDFPGFLSRTASTALEPSNEKELVVPKISVNPEPSNEKELVVPKISVIPEPVVNVESLDVEEQPKGEDNIEKGETVEEESEEEEYDPIPKVPDRTDRTESTGELDSLKHEYLEKMRDFYRYMRTVWRQARPSLETQAETEKRFVKLVRQYKEIIGVVPFSYDKTMQMATREVSQLKRIVSDTTRMYATGAPYGESGKENMTETAPTVFVNNNYMAGSKRVLSILGEGKLVGDARTWITCQGTVGCAARSPDGLVYTVFDKENSTKLVYGDKSVNTGFFSRGATSIIFDESYEYIFVAGDVRVKCFKADTLECIDTFYCRMSETQGRSCIAIVNQTLVLADDEKVFFWSLENLGAEEHQATDAFRKQFRDSMSRAGVNPQFVDWTPGKKPDNIKIKHEFSHITAMCVVGNILAIASEDCEAVHLFKRDPDRRTFSLCGRLIGHSAGITCMTATKDGKLITGSHDKLLRVWDLDTLLAEVQFCGHESSVIAVAAVTLSNVPVIITAGKDSTIYFWDVQAKKIVIKISVSPIDEKDAERKACATCIAFEPEANRLDFVAEIGLDTDSQRQTMWDRYSTPKCELQFYQFVKP